MIRLNGYIDVPDNFDSSTLPDNFIVGGRTQLTPDPTEFNITVTVKADTQAEAQAIVDSAMSLKSLIREKKTVSADE